MGAVLEIVTAVPLVAICDTGPIALQAAAVALDAVKTCPAVGAVALRVTAVPLVAIRSAVCDVLALPVAFVSTRAEGVPNAGVTSVGEVAKTNAPEPVSPVTAEARLADEGVAKKVATPVPNPVTSDPMATDLDVQAAALVLVVSRTRPAPEGAAPPMVTAHKLLSVKPGEKG